MIVPRSIPRRRYRRAGPRPQPSVTRFGRGWHSNFDAAIGFTSTLFDPAGSFNNNSRIHLVTVEGHEVVFRYSTTLVKWQPACYNSMTGNWNVPRTDFNASQICPVRVKIWPGRVKPGNWTGHRFKRS